jgi:glycosyltransferase involved in cell wall biosynthesis
MYGRLIKEKRSSSLVVNIIHTSHPEYRRFKSENVTFIPLYGSGFARCITLYRELVQLHAQQPLSVIATQDIFVDAWIALFFSKRHSCRTIGQIHADIFSDAAGEELLGKGWRRFIKRWLAFKLLKQYTAIRTVGEGIAREMKARHMHNNIYVIPVPVSMMLSGDDDHAGSRDDSPVVLFVGRLVPIKNLSLWIEIAQLIAKAYPATRFLIAGDGPERMELERLVAAKGLREAVSFLGYVPYKELKALYKRASVFLLTSVAEGFGRVVVEAGYNGLPVVAPRVRGVEDIIKDGTTGYLHDPQDAKGMAERVVCLLKDHQLRKKMGEEARSFVKSNFDPRSFAAAWADLLVRIAAAD